MERKEEKWKRQRKMERSEKMERKEEKWKEQMKNRKKRGKWEETSPHPSLKKPSPSNFGTKEQKLITAATVQ